MGIYIFDIIILQYYIIYIVICIGLDIFNNKKFKLIYL